MTPARLEFERVTLRRLERVRYCALEEGAYGTPGLDACIAETRAVIATLELELGTVPCDNINAPATVERPGAGTGGSSSHAPATFTHEATP